MVCISHKNTERALAKTTFAEILLAVAKLSFFDPQLIAFTLRYYPPAILGGGKTDEDEVENGQRQA